MADMAAPLPEKIFGLLSIAMTERKVLGVELVDDTLRRDVMQVTVSFFNHRYLGLTSNEQDTRRELKKRDAKCLLQAVAANYPFDIWAMAFNT